MRTLPLLVLLALAAPAWGQSPTVRLGGDVVAGYHGHDEADLAIGAAGAVQVRTEGRVGAYAAVRPEATVRTEGGTGFYRDREVASYDSDGLPVYGGGACRSVVDGGASPGSCGAGVLSVALGAEVGTRLAAGGGAVLVGAGLRAGAGRGLYGAVTGQLASPIYGRLEVGTGHVMAGFGFGSF